jgi:hypothetical protein
VQKSGGTKALTKQIHDDLKLHLTPEDAKIEVAPAIIDTPLVIAAPSITRKPKAGKVKVRMVKAKMNTIKKSRLEKATSHLYDLEDSHGPEKALNIDLGLYQMEDF